MPHKPLQDTDRLDIQMLLDARVLGHHIPERLNVSDGVILVCCADGDQFAKMMDHMRDTVIVAGVKPRIHTLAHHGGALLVSPQCPLFKEHKIDLFMRTQLQQAQTMKDINTVVLSVHAPCGAASMAKLSTIELIDHMMRAKLVVKADLPQVKVLCVLFVDFGNGDKRSFTVARKDWDRFRGTRYATGEFPALTGSMSHATP